MIVFIIDLALIIITHNNWNTPMKKYLPVQKELLTLRNSITDAGYWFKESSINNNTLSQKNRAIRQLTTYDFNTFMNTQGVKQDAGLLSILLKLEQLLEKLRTTKALETPQQKAAFYDEFQRVLTLIDLIILNVDQKLQYELQEKESFFTYIIGIFFAINITIFTLLYYSKERIERLALALEEEHALSTAAIQHASEHDDLTGLPNRVLLYDRLQQMIKQAQYDNHMFALFFIDMDHFKKINDSMGHKTGDRLLKLMGERLSNAVNDTDTVARLGGDEFCILVDNAHNTQKIAETVQRLQEQICEGITIDKYDIYPAASIGITVFPNDGERADVLMRNGDIAMYKAKEHGRNTYRFFTEEMSRQTLERAEIEKGLRTAINEDHLRVFFQPKINALNEQLIGMEALVRWQHPDKGLIPPGQFIPIAEQSGLIYQLDLWVMEHTMEQVLKWYEKGYSPGKVSLNLSMHYFKDDAFIAKFEQLLKTTGCPAELLELEVTESQIMQNPETGIAMLNQLKALGITLSIDDFGTGYSSLSYLKKLPIDKLKIDQSFVAGLPHDRDDVAIISSIIALAESMKLDTIAEGVETIAQLEVLVELGCTTIQGYLYDKPIEADTFEEHFFHAG
jgi:diguanylate cyclase (GGDEF)-like protein